MELAEKKKIIGERQLSKRAMAILRSISFDQPSLSKSSILLMN